MRDNGLSTFARRLTGVALSVCVVGQCVHARNDDGYVYTNLVDLSFLREIESRILDDVAEIAKPGDENSDVCNYVWDIDVNIPDGNGGYVTADRNILLGKCDDFIVYVVPVSFDYKDRFLDNDESVKNLHIRGRKLLFTSQFDLGDQTGGREIRKEPYLRIVNRNHQLPYWTFTVKDGCVVSSRMNEIPVSKNRYDLMVHPVYDY